MPWYVRVCYEEKKIELLQNIGGYVYRKAERVYYGNPTNPPAYKVSVLVLACVHPITGPHIRRECTERLR